jgi:hypothetical protein
MAVGALLHAGLAETMACTVPGLSYISNYFSPMTNEPSTQKPNEGWNHPINGDADRNFRVYIQNPPGLPRDDISLDHDLKALADYGISCYGFAETNLDWG